MRRACAVLAVLLLAACAGDGSGRRPQAGSPGPRGTASAQPAVAATPTPPPTGAGGSGGTPRPPGSDGGAQATAAPAPTQATPRGPHPDDGLVGGNALTYLRGSTPKMVIEVDAVSGREPQGTTLNHLLGSLRQVLDKPGGIGPRPTETFPGTKPKYTVEDLVALESAHRQTHTSGGEASLYILFLNGSFEREEVIGASYSASAYAIFVDTIRSVAEGNPFMSAADVERAVVLHEAGHLLRLVNIGYRSPRDHEDPDHEHHSSNPQSVMFHAVESSLIGSVFSGPPPDTFDADDKADLADLRSGRIKPT